MLVSTKQMILGTFAYRAAHISALPFAFAPSKNLLALNPEKLARAQRESERARARARAYTHSVHTLTNRPARAHTPSLLKITQRGIDVAPRFCAVPCPAPKAVRELLPLCVMPDSPHNPSHACRTAIPGSRHCKNRLSSGLYGFLQPAPSL